MRKKLKDLSLSKPLTLSICLMSMAIFQFTIFILIPILIILTNKLNKVSDEYCSGSKL